MSVNRGSDFIFQETYEKPYDENSVEESYEELLMKIVSKSARWAH